MSKVCFTHILIEQGVLFILLAKYTEYSSKMADMSVTNEICQYLPLRLSSDPQVIFIDQACFAAGLPGASPQGGMVTNSSAAVG